MAKRTALLVDFADVTVRDVPSVGGKNASLGEMANRLKRAGVRVPPGFATTAFAYWGFVKANELKAPMTAAFSEFRRGKTSLKTVGANLRKMIMRARLPDDLRRGIARAHARLVKAAGGGAVAMAVRSSATAEDLPSASFAGQHDSFLNIVGIGAVESAVKACIASLFNDRAIAYREKNGFDHMKIALSVGVQHMVRSDRGAAGVMFTLDPETGFPDVVRIEGAWGLGELVVQGEVDPDSYMVFEPLLKDRRKVPVIDRTLGQKRRKMVLTRNPRRPIKPVATTDRERSKFVLTDGDLLILARWALLIERHYKREMDIEWAKDGKTGKLYIVQARPETVQSRASADAFKSYALVKRGKPLVSGLAVGDGIGVGTVATVRDPHDVAAFPAGAVLVAEATDPDWVPIMRKAAAIVTEHGGRTSHAAIVSREFGLPAIVGAAGARATLKSGQAITVSCAEGDIGNVYAGHVPFTMRRMRVRDLPATKTQIMLNVANPAAAMRWWRLNADGVGLARLEFIISNHIKIHPLALVRYDEVKDPVARRAIAAMTIGYDDKAEFFVDRLALGVARIAAAFHPRPVIVRLSDFKSNEYAALIGGAQFEPHEENPMIGWRGASRYYSDDYRAGFELECRALAKVRKTIGLENVKVMIPFCRTTGEADKVLAIMARHGLKRGREGLEVYVMCEIPANVILAEAFAKRFDGFSIGSNDLTQLTLGVDRDSDRLAPLFKEDNPAVLQSIRHVIAAAHRAHRKIGLCGQAPSDHPVFAKVLVEAGIDSISVIPDSFINVKRHVAAAEMAEGRRGATRRRR